MKVDLSRHPSGVFVLRIEGPFTVEAYGAALARSAQTPGFRPDSHTVWDLRQADLADVQAEDLRQAVATHARHRARSEGARSAIVVTREVDYGVARMFQAFADDLPQEFRLFRNMDTALGWAATGFADPEDADLLA